MFVVWRAVTWAGWSLDEQLPLVYTGQRLLAKDLLQAGMGHWMACAPDMVRMTKEIAQLAEAMRDALESGDRTNSEFVPFVHR